MPIWIVTVAQFVADVLVDVYELLKLQRPISKAKDRKANRLHKPRKHIKDCKCKNCEGKHGGK